LQGIVGEEKRDSVGSMGRKQRRVLGFTLIELMGVIGIMGMLFILLMPYIRGYNARAKVSEAMLMLSQCRNQVYEGYASGSDLPDDNAWGCEADKPSRYVSSVTTTKEGVVKVELGNEIGDLRLSLHYISLAPLNGAGNLMGEADLGTPIRRWRCGSSIDGTDIKPDLLPSSCRG
jgi:type IV pilus assembly protein PilA